MRVHFLNFHRVEKSGSAELFRVEAIVSYDSVGNCVYINCHFSRLSKIGKTAAREYGGYAITNTAPKGYDQIIPDRIAQPSLTITFTMSVQRTIQKQSSEAQPSSSHIYISSIVYLFIESFRPGRDVSMVSLLPNCTND